MEPLVSIVVPLYNEADNAPLLMQRVHEAMSALKGYRYEAIFVDDGSTDGTGTVLETRPLYFARNFGQSAAVIAGMRAAQGDFILTADGDLQNDPADFPRIIALLQEYDCVCGYREKRQDTLMRRFSSRVANKVRNAILHDGIRDSGCGVKGFRRAVIPHLVCFNGVHRFFAAVVRGAGFTITECPVHHHPRVHGVSKYGISNRLWRGIYDLIGVSWLVRRYVPYEIAPDK
jgi:dolichol-phosphate mannosyltransferase